VNLCRRTLDWIGFKIIYIYEWIQEIRGISRNEGAMCIQNYSHLLNIMF